MKPLTVISASFALALCAGALSAYLLRPAAPTAAHAAEPVARMVTIDGALGERLSALEQRVAELAARPVGAASMERRPVDDLDAAVRRVLAEQDAGALVTLTVDPAAALAEGRDALPPDTDALLALLAQGSGDMSNQHLWERVRAAGRMDEVLAAYEALAAARPDDPAAQLDLGVAYLQKLFQAPDGPLKGMIAMQADAAFDRALELDPGHWEARFTKAVSLSHWPPIFGKQTQAIAHFETLIAQQKTLAPEPKHAEAYLLLGNLYIASGKHEQALALWQEGAAVFPGHGGLLEALSSSAGGQ